MDRIEALGNLLKFNVNYDFTRQENHSSECNSTNKCATKKYSEIKITENSLILEYSKNNYVWTFKKRDQPKFDLLKETIVFPKTSHFSLPVLKFNTLFQQFSSNVPNADKSLPNSENSNKSYFHQLNLNKIKNYNLNLQSNLNVQRNLASTVYPNVRFVNFLVPHIFKRNYAIDLMTLYNKCSFPRHYRSSLFNYFRPKEQFTLPYLNIFSKNKLLSLVLYKFVWRRNLTKPNLCENNSCTENSKNISNESADDNVIKTKPTLLSTLAKIRTNVRNLQSKIDEEIIRKDLKHKMFLEQCQDICNSLPTSHTDFENLSDLNYENKTKMDEEFERKSSCLNQKVLDEHYTSNSENVDTKNETIELEVELVKSPKVHNVIFKDFQTNRKDQYMDYFTGIKTTIREIPGIFTSSLSYLANRSARIIVRFAGRNALTMCCF